MTYRPTDEMIARVDRLDSYGGIVRGEWQGRDAEGREIACWLGALDPAIKTRSSCPADVMPQWLALLTPAIDDNISNAAWPDLWQRYRALLRRWHVLDDTAWWRCDLRTRDAALAIVEPYDTADVVAPVRALIARELFGDAPSDPEWIAARTAAAEAAKAAWSATWATAARATAARAAEAARAAAARAAEAGAVTAARAAEAGAVTAAEAAKAAWSATWATAARAAAWDRIADACLSAIEEECDRAEGKI
jgi:hypothetical protein